MYKRASKKSGGALVHGWSTGQKTSPNDYRAIERQKRAAAERLGALAKQVRSFDEDKVWQYLSSIAISQIRNARLPKVPNAIKHMIGDEVEKYGTLRWAWRQPDYSKILKKQNQLEERRLKKAKKAKGATYPL